MCEDGVERRCPDCGAEMEQVDSGGTSGPPAWECPECCRAVREGADDPELRADGGKPADGVERPNPMGTDGDMGTCDRCPKTLSDPTAVHTEVNGVERKEWVCPDCEPEAREDEVPVADGSGEPADGVERQDCESCGHYTEVEPRDPESIVRLDEDDLLWEDWSDEPRLCDACAQAFQTPAKVPRTDGGTDADGPYRTFCAYDHRGRAPGCGIENRARTEREAEKLVELHEERTGHHADFEPLSDTTSTEVGRDV